MPQRLVVAETGRSLAETVHRARSFAERGRGLLGRPPLGPGEALVIDRARQVHTFGMGYPIDVCFCDRAWRVVHVVGSMKALRMTRWVRRAAFVVEMRAGGMAGVRTGDQLSLEDLNER